MAPLGFLATEPRLRRRFIKKRDSQSLKDLLFYLVDHDRPFSMDDPELREALFSLESWDVGKSHQGILFSSVQQYLFNQIERSQNKEWTAWLRSSRILHQPIGVMQLDVSEALAKAYRSGKLQDLPAEDFVYLIDCYSPNYRNAIGKIEMHDWPAKYKILLNLTALCRSLIELKDTRNSKLALTDLLAFVEQYGCAFPIEEPTIREAVFAADFWEIDSAYHPLLFSVVESVLFGNVYMTNPHEWKTWVRACRNLKWQIDVMRPDVSRALRGAQRASKLVDLPKDEYHYLLECYLQSYGKVLDGLDPSDEDGLPLFLEYASIAQIIGPNNFSQRIVERWTKNLPVCPRALTSLSDEQAYFAPLSGVGSPHGVSITQYYAPLSITPVRISCAGTTGDPTLNSQIFTSLFAAALACDSEPSFVTSVGSTLSLTPQQRQIWAVPAVDTGQDVNDKRPLIHAVIGPSGPVEPKPGMPLLGMEASEALELIRDMFERFQESTGLVHIMRWQVQDAEQLEQQVAEAMKSGTDGIVMIKSDANRAEEAGIIHLTPLLHRMSDNQIVPVRIEMPYHLLGSEQVFDLVHKARRTYMKQLIAASHHRQALAEQTYNRESQTVLWWASLSANEKESICQQSPIVLVSQQIDFELGITLPLDPPEEVARVAFEMQNRPQLRDAAKMYAKRFTALCAKLEEIDQDGGRADVVTFKLLIDSLIRRAPLPVTYPEIQEEYKHWLQNHAATVWQTITEWASQRGLLPETLAADNIVFNACLDASQASVIIEPWAMLDLHDFVIRIDRKQGLMEVFAGGKKDTLGAALIPDPDLGILTLEDLREKFYSWLDAAKRLKDVRSREEEEIQSKILHSPGTHTLLQLRIAKLLLSRGRIPDAIAIINSIRRKDLAVIYFWGAVAYQCQYLEKKNVDFHLGLEGLEPNARANRLINIAIQTLIEALTPEASIGGLVFPNSDYDLESPTFAAPKRSVPVDNDASDYLDQMMAKDQSFADGLVQHKDFHMLERNSLRLSPKTEEQIDAAIAALSSLELLNLAEMMKDTARALPFTGLWTSDLRKSVEAIIAAANAVKVQPPSVIQEIEQLRNLTYG